MTICLFVFVGMRSPVHAVHARSATARQVHYLIISPMLLSLHGFPVLFYSTTVKPDGDLGCLVLDNSAEASIHGPMFWAKQLVVLHSLIS